MYTLSESCLCGCESMYALKVVFVAVRVCML